MVLLDSLSSLQPNQLHCVGMPQLQTHCQAQEAAHQLDLSCSQYVTNWAADGLAANLQVAGLLPVACSCSVQPLWQPHSDWTTGMVPALLQAPLWLGCCQLL